MKQLIIAVLIALFGVCIFSCDKDETPSTGTIYGIVNDADSGEPIRNTTVSLNPGGVSVHTGSDGRYEFLNLQPGQYTLQIISNEYQSNTKRVTVIAGKQASGDMQLTRGSAKLKISVESLNFGTSSNQLTFSIMNIGTSGSISWSISKEAEWLSVTPTSGTTSKNDDIIVTISRDKITKNMEDFILINTDRESHSLLITAEFKSNGGNEGGNEGTDDVNLNAGLIAHYNFDNANANDASENKLNANLINSPDFISETASGNGKALSLKSSQKQYMNIPYNPLKNCNNYSISMWIKDFGQGILFSAISDDSKRSDYPRIYARSDGKFTFYTGYDNFDTTTPFTYQYKAIQDAKWHHIVVVCKSTENNKCLKELYIDGQLTDSNEGLTNPSSQGSCSKIYIGGNSDGKYEVFTDNMKIDNIRIYNISINAKEVKALYNKEI